MIELATRRRREAVLREMGLGPLWRLRGRDAEGGQQGSVEAVQEVAPAVASAGVSLAGTAGLHDSEIPQGRQARPVQSAVRPISMDAPSTRPAAPGAGLPRFPLVNQGARLQPERADRIGTLEWDALEEDIRACQACGLCERRRQAVPGVGDRQARWMLVGEAPGAEEDQRGEPFVGQAGRLLDNMLAALGLKRGESVYIANAVKCRPPHNRTPEATELSTCLPYLRRQIELVQPTLLVALGRPAAQALLDTEIRIGAARGRAFRHGDIPVVVTYHPAYLLRNPQDKAKAWEDLCFARRLMTEAAATDRR